MTQSDDEQKSIVNWQDMTTGRLTPDILERMGKLLEAALPIGSIFTAATQRAALFERKAVLQPFPKRPPAVQVVMDKYQTLHAHFMRGLISSDDIGGLLDACSLELVEVIERHKDEYKNYQNPYDEPDDVVWRICGFRYSYGYRGSSYIIPTSE